MQIILALGNYGEKYAATRHNAGWLLADHIAAQQGFSPFQNEARFFAHVARGSIGGQATLIVKPQTYMNLSGKALGQILHFYKAEPKDVLILSDDVDTALGRVVFRQKGGHGGHNGLRDVFRVIGHNEVARVKIGIKNPDTRGQMPTDAFVLGKFTEAERTILKELMPEAGKKVLAWAADAR